NVCPPGDSYYSITVTDNQGRSSSATSVVTIDPDPFCGQSLECHKEDCAGPFGTYFINPTNTPVTYADAQANGWCYEIDQSALPAVLCFAFKAGDPNATFEQFSLLISYENCSGGSSINGGFYAGFQNTTVISNSINQNATGGSTGTSGGCFQVTNYFDIGGDGIRECEEEGTWHYPDCDKVANALVGGVNCNLLTPGDIYTHCFDLKPSACGKVYICPIYNCGNGCVPDPPCLDIENVVRTTDASCFGSDDGSATALVCADSLFSYVWSTGATTKSIFNLSPASYTVTITETETGCDTTRTLSISEPPQIMVDAGLTKDLCTNESYKLGGTPVATGGMGNFSYLWYPAPNLDDPTLSNPTVSGLTEPVTYTVIATDSTGCADSAQVLINGRLCDITIPNVFTPNHEGPNDNFVIDGIEYFPGSRLLVFNRWGEKVWESQNYHNDWDGRHWKSLNRLNEGVYYWILYLNDPLTPGPDENNTRHGWVHLIRNNNDIN
ncbi:MAG: gliding motility-associated C-terminal domain-containing protein, partial [Flavobacteriales bacterium]|nr:gliding motility-associated C-terminal domain-containing protein [Flavobacteriales bacterium]